MKIISAGLNACKDMMSDKTRSRITDQEVTFHCTTLAKKISKEYQPDIVIAIDTGGSVPGELIGHALGVDVVHITIRRDIKMGRRYSLDPIPIRWIMSLYHHYLFRSTKPLISTNLNADVSSKRVLVVDDAMHTGITIDVALAYLTEMGASSIKVACLSHVGVRTPDFSVLPKGNYSFPWSEDHRKVTRDHP